jgi:hypothetical protein
MAIKLEWEIDDVDAPLPGVEEKTSKGAGRRRWWRLLALIVLAVAIGLGYLGLRIRQKKNEIEEELRAVVKLELQALVKGDRDLFLNQQDPDSGRWHAVQEKAFDDYHGQRTQDWGNVEYTGQVPVVRVEGEQGWALVEVMRGESAWRELWVYQQTQAEGWRHTRPAADWLGDEQKHKTAHLRFNYPRRDKAIVTALGQEMEAWYDVLAPLFFGAKPTLAGRPVLAVEFGYRDPSRPDKMVASWHEGRSYTLLAPSPHLSYFLADDSPSPELRQQMAGYLIEALIARQAGLHPDETLSVEVNALRHELRDWAANYLARASPDLVEPNTPPTPLVEALTAREGAQVVSRLAAELDGPETLDQVRVAANLAPPDPMTHFAFLLVADRRALYTLNADDYGALADPEADKTWRDQRSNQWTVLWESYGEMSSFPWPALQVRSLVFDGEMAWVEAESTQREGSVSRQVHFFRRVPVGGGERWLQTSPDPLYFGEHRVRRTENLILRYFERDAQWYEETLPGELQAVFVQAASDLGIPTGNLTFTMEIGILPQYDQHVSASMSKLTFPSPRITGWSVDDPDALVFQHAFWLVRALPYLKMSSSSTGPYPLSYSTVPFALTRWELDRLFPEFTERSWPPINARQVSALTLTDLWPTSPTSVGQQEWERLMNAHWTLIAYLAETYGPGVVPMLLETLSQAGDMEEWLRLSTGHGVEEIEPGWRAWVLATYQGQ